MLRRSGVPPCDSSVRNRDVPAPVHVIDSRTLWKNALAAVSNWALGQRANQRSANGATANVLEKPRPLPGLPSATWKPQISDTFCCSGSRSTILPDMLKEESLTGAPTIGSAEASVHDDPS